MTDKTPNVTVLEGEAAYETYAEYIYFEKMKFCGCGIPEDMRDAFIKSTRALRECWAVIRSTESAFSIARTEADRAKDKAAWDKLYADIADIWGPSDLNRYLCWYVLDAAGLTEHGGSVPGWLTPEGERFAAEKLSDE